MFVLSLKQWLLELAHDGQRVMKRAGLPKAQLDAQRLHESCDTRDDNKDDRKNAARFGLPWEQEDEQQKEQWRHIGGLSFEPGFAMRTGQRKRPTGQIEEKRNVQRMAAPGAVRHNDLHSACKKYTAFMLQLCESSRES